MSTDLFGQYFNNPTKSYIYANMACNGESADEMSFDIVGSDGVISNNEDTLSKIDLSGVHVTLTQYTNDMKTINPYSFIYVKGIDMGESYTTKVFGRLGSYSTDIENWMYKTTMILHIKYVNEYGAKVIKCIRAAGSEYDELTFIEAAQSIFDELEIPINVTIDDGFVYLTSTKLGFDFWVSHIEMWHYIGEEITCNEEEIEETIEDTNEQDQNLGYGFNSSWETSSMDSNTYYVNSAESINAFRTPLSEESYQELYKRKYYEMTAVRGESKFYDVTTNFEGDDMIDVSTNFVRNVFLFEDLTKYIPNIKYRNGAMKGCLVFATYPVFNAENIPETQRALKIGHLVDRVEEFYDDIHNEVTSVPVYARVIRDVVDSYYSQYEFDIFKKWSNGYSHISKNDSWIEPGEIPVVKTFDEHEPSMWSNSHVPHEYKLNLMYKDEAKYDAIGLFGYANYLSKHNQWFTMGQVYLRTTVEDDESMNTRNLIPSFLIYNPNPFPVVVKYMTFV